METPVPPVAPTGRGLARVQIGAAVCLAFAIGAGGAFLHDESERRRLAKTAYMAETADVAKTADVTSDPGRDAAAIATRTGLLRLRWSEMPFPEAQRQADVVFGQRAGGVRKVLPDGPPRESGTRAR